MMTTLERTYQEPGVDEQPPRFLENPSIRTPLSWRSCDERTRGRRRPS